MIDTKLKPGGVRPLFFLGRSLGLRLPQNRALGKADKLCPPASLTKSQGGARSNRMGNYWGQISTDQSNELSSKPVEDLSWRNDLEWEKNVMAFFSYLDPGGQ